jgi:hypothetical protein
LITLQIVTSYNQKTCHLQKQGVSSSVSSGAWWLTAPMAVVGTYVTPLFIIVQNNMLEQLHINKHCAKNRVASAAKALALAAGAGS